MFLKSNVNLILFFTDQIDFKTFFYILNNKIKKKIKIKKIKFAYQFLTNVLLGFYLEKSTI